MTLQYPDDPLRRESHEMRASQWAALDELAARLGCVNERGPKAGQPSWRALLYRMAETLTGTTPKSPKQQPDQNKITPLDAAICELFGIEPTPLWNKEMIREARQRRDSNTQS